MTSLPAALDLSGRTALVTGSTRGLGRAIARSMASLGATVAINGRDAATVARCCEEIADEGGRAVPAPFDVTDREATEAAVATVVAETGSLDILVANASVWLRGRIEDATDADMQAAFEIKSRAAFVATQAVLPHMKQRAWGRIVMISGISVVAASGASPVDTANQGALVGLMRAFAPKLGPYGITCNIVAPGYFRTDMSRALQDDIEFNDWLARRVPAGRWGKPEEIGWTVAFLCSDAAGYISSQLLTVDGGLTTSL